MKYCFGVDIGGTTVKLGLFSEAGAIVEKWEIVTRTEDEGSAILPDIAEAINGKLEQHGIEKERILKETASTTTRENLRFSKALFTPEIVKVGIVTNNFHLHRSCALANRLGYPHVYPISAGCKGSLFLNYMMREVPAMWKFWLDKEKDSDII